MRQGPVHVVDRDAETSRVAARSLAEQSQKYSPKLCNMFKWFRESIVWVPGLQSLWLKRTSKFAVHHYIGGRALFFQHPRIVSGLLSLRLGKREVSAEHSIQHRRFGRPLLERSGRPTTASVGREVLMQLYPSLKIASEAFPHPPLQHYAPWLCTATNAVFLSKLTKSSLTHSPRTSSDVSFWGPPFHPL
jgi:hypothetical protein